MSADNLTTLYALREALAESIAAEEEALRGSAGGRNAVQAGRFGTVEVEWSRPAFRKTLAAEDKTTFEQLVGEHGVEVAFQGRPFFPAERKITQEQIEKALKFLDSPEGRAAYPGLAITFGSAVKAVTEAQVARYEDDSKNVARASVTVKLADGATDLLRNSLVARRAEGDLTAGMLCEVLGLGEATEATPAPTPEPVAVGAGFTTPVPARETGEEDLSPARMIEHAVRDFGGVV